MVQGDGGEREGEGEIDCGEEGDWGNVCFLSNAKKTFNDNHAPKQTALLCSVLPSPLTFIQSLKFSKRSISMKGQRWKNIVVICHTPNFDHSFLFFLPIFIRILKPE